MLEAGWGGSSSVSGRSATMLEGLGGVPWIAGLTSVLILSCGGRTGLLAVPDASSDSVAAQPDDVAEEGASVCSPPPQYSDDGNPGAWVEANTFLYCNPGCSCLSNNRTDCLPDYDPNATGICDQDAGCTNQCNADQYALRGSGGGCSHGAKLSADRD